MTFEGICDDGAPGAPYFRTVPRFETAEAKYSFLNRLLAVGRGEIRADGAGSRDRRDPLMDARDDRYPIPIAFPSANQTDNE